MDEDWQHSDESEWDEWSSGEPAGDSIEMADDLAGDPEPASGSPAAGSLDAAVRMDELKRAQSQLWTALRSEDDPEIRMGLLSYLSENRSAILHLGRQWGLETHLPSEASPGHGAGPAPRRDPVWADVAASGAATARPAVRPPSVPDPATMAFPVAPSLVPPPPAPPAMRSLGSRPAVRRSGGFTGLVQSGLKRVGDPQSTQRVAVLLGALLSVLGVAWLVLAQPFGRGEETSAGADRDAATQTTSADRSAQVAKIAAVLQSMGLTGVSVEQRGDAIHLSGTVASEDEKTKVIGVVEALVAGDAEVTSELAVVTGPVLAGAPALDAGGRAAALQTEINRLVAATPLIFESGQTSLTELHIRILNNVATILRAYPDIAVTVVGYTDKVGSDDANTGLSLGRADSVKAYLVTQGVSETGLVTEARGEATSTGSEALASLERRVEFEVVAAPASAPVAADKPPLRIAIVAPSARNDLAFTQSMVDAVNLVAAERGNVEVAITDNTFVPKEAAAAIRSYADQGYDLIIAHGVEFGSDLVAIVTDHPDVTFAWGTATDTLNLPNLYAYDAAAEEGGYVMGAMASMLSAKGVVGVVGPIEVADAKRYVNGFRAGAVAEKPGTSVPVTYTGSFSDIPLASEAAKGHVAAGADVLSGTAEMVVGAIAVARDNNALWFGTQANQAPLAPNLVVASQVYHWEVLLRPIVGDIEAGTVQGRGQVAKLDNGGLVVEYNPGYPLPEPVRQRAEQLVADLKNGAVVAPAG